MSKPTLYALTALFDKPDEIVAACEKVRKAGYTKFDAHTPYPVHGMDDAMGLPPSKIGYVAFMCGLAGLTGLLLFIAWSVLADYPHIIAGKPYFSLPAYIPPLFESAVFCTGVFGTLALIVFFMKMPHAKHPLHDTPYMNRVSDDMFGVVVEAADPLFDEEKLRQLYQELGAKETLAIHYDLTEEVRRHPLNMKFVAFLITTGILASAFFYVVMNEVAYFKPFNWMTNLPQVSAQSKNAFFADGMSMRLPVEGTVARGYIPYAYAADPVQAGEHLVNPLPVTEEVLAHGKQGFETNCSMCHGNYGLGDSRLQGKFPAGPTVHSGKVVDWPDGRLYHIITAGQGSMPGYARQITREQRWAIVHYMRALQRSQNPKE